MDKSYSKLRKEIVSWGMRGVSKQEEISAKTGVSQSQVSKILSGRFKTISPNVKKVCEYANIQIYSKKGLVLTEGLHDAVMDLWDGSEDSEKALIKALKSMKVLIGNGCVQE